MKKWNDDGMECVSCIYNNYWGCFDELCKFSKSESEYMCSDNNYRFYANIEETEHLLNLWDEANGSIAEWRENAKPFKTWKSEKDCWECYGRGQCGLWSKECGGNGKCLDFGIVTTGWVTAKYYADKDRTEALLKWHDGRYGKIGERLMDVGEKLDSMKVYGEKEKAVDDIVKCSKCPSCGCSETDLENEKSRMCARCHNAWRTDVDYDEKAVDDLDFRVGDAVYYLPARKNGVVKFETDDTNPGYPIVVAFKEGTTASFSKSGKLCYPGNDKRDLYHGHDLKMKVTVEERKPVRAITKWVFLYRLNSEPVKASGEFDAKIDCLRERKSYSRCKGYTILSEPIKVDIPE